jgi:excisionase family DNA binding protein
VSGYLPPIRQEAGNKLSAGSERESAILTVTEVASALRCSKAHVHNLINGKVHGTSPLPSLRLGRRRIVRRESLLDWIERNEQSAGYAMIRSSPDVDPVDA